MEDTHRTRRPDRDTRSSRLRSSAAHRSSRTRVSTPRSELATRVGHRLASTPRHFMSVRNTAPVPSLTKRRGTSKTGTTAARVVAHKRHPDLVPLGRVCPQGRVQARGSRFGRTDRAPRALRAASVCNQDVPLHVHPHQTILDSLDSTHAYHCHTTSGPPCSNEIGNLRCEPFPLFAPATVLHCSV